MGIYYDDYNLVVHDDPDCECLSCGTEWHSGEFSVCPECGWNGEYCRRCEQALTADTFTYESGDFLCDECAELIHANDF